MENLFALIDCNNFYVSCERVFNPQYQGKAVVVLSNNDGCIIARSNEAKALGIAMGTPFFKCKDIINRYRVEVLSSNYALYGDMSRRVMNTLQQFTPSLEVYSIDEAFLSLTGAHDTSFSDYARTIKMTVRQWTGIPVSVGIGPTKVLAKIANKLAKRVETYGGIFDLTACKDIDVLLESLTVHELWGIGRQYASLLSRHGILTARQLKYADDGWIRKHLTVTGLRILWELRGISCIPLEEAPPPKKGIGSSRSFGRPVEALDELSEAVSSYISRAAEKLRAQCSLASVLHVYLGTNRFRQMPQYSNGITLTLSVPTSFTPHLIRYAKEGLKKIYKKGFQYQKAGVFLSGIVPQDQVQLGLFTRDRLTAGYKRALMDSIDGINRKWGKGTLQCASAGVKQTWGMRQEMKSKNFTTRWDELPVARAG